jgi:serine/threonine-protein kinase
MADADPEPATIADLVTEHWAPPYESVHVDWKPDPTTVATDPVELPVPVTAPGAILLGRYRVEAILGHGGTGVVVRAHDPRTRRHVAIKLLKPLLASDPSQVDRFLREARAMLQLRGDHTARVLDVGTQRDGTPVIVMELLDGPDLCRVLQQLGRQHPALVADWMLQVCEGLSEAHALGIVHRDIKLSNLLFTRTRDGGHRLKIVDFGMSKHSDPTDEPTGVAAVLGTPPYMAPEHLWQSRAVDQRSDIWSIGVVMYRLVTGRMPFEPETLEGMRAVINRRSPSPIEAPLPPGFGEVILRCLEKQPEQRFQTVAELAAALARFTVNPAMGWASAERTRRVLHGVPAMPVVRPAVATAMEPPPPERRSHGRSFRVIVLSAAATLGVAFGAFTAGAEIAPPPPAPRTVEAPRPIEAPPPSVSAAPEETPREVEPPPPQAAAPAPAMAAGPTHTCEREHVREKVRRSKRQARAARERARERARLRAERAVVAEDLFASRR